MVVFFTIPQPLCGSGKKYSIFFNLIMFTDDLYRGAGQELLKNRKIIYIQAPGIMPDWIAFYL